MVLYKNWAIGGTAWTQRDDGVIIRPSHPTIIDGNETTCETTSGGGGPTFHTIVDMGTAHTINTIRIKAAMQSYPGDFGIRAGMDPVPPQITVVSLPANTPVWREVSGLNMSARYIAISGGWYLTTCEVQGLETLTTTTLSALLDRSIVQPDSQFTVFGNVKDQYNNPMNGQIINIGIYKTGVLFTSTTVTSDINGDYSKAINTIGWTPDTYEVRVISDTITRSSNITVIYTGSIMFTSICIDTGLECITDVFLDDTLKGVTPLTLNDIPVGTHNYRISRSGYIDVVGTVDVIQGTTANVNVSLNPIPGDLSISSTPPGADIYIDDVLQIGVTTPATIIGLTPGTHSYKLTYTGYQDSTGTFEIISGQVTTLPSITLSPNLGGVTVTSTPSGADVYIDDILQPGVTPITIMGYNPGTHSYKLTYPGYYDTIGTFEIISDQIVPLDIVMTLITGSLDISSTPPGAEIFINDVDQNVVTPFTITGVAPGHYTYKLTLPGYNDAIGTFDLVDGYTVTIADTLILITGSLDISSTPPGADIYIDDVLQTGIVTPSIITNLTPGVHTYKLTLPGYSDKTDSFDIIDGLIEVVSVTLQPIVIQAGFESTGIFLITGLVIGGIYMMSKKKKKKEY